VPRKPPVPKKRKLSLWVDTRKPNMKAMKGVDILKDLCGVKSYDLDDQELSAAGDSFPKAPFAEILSRLSYSSSFQEAANQAAKERKITHAYWVLAQYDFVYDPRRRKSVAAEPLFLGVFDWDDSEDDEM
jgi:hypothetical protein